jgi:hypothetical protein
LGISSAYESLSLNSHLFAVVMNNLDPQYLGQIRDVGMAAIEDDGIVEAARPQPLPAAAQQQQPVEGGDDDPELPDQRPEAIVAAAIAALPVPAAAAAPSPSSASSELLYSGLYAYHIPTNTWALLRCDVGMPKPVKPTVRSRVGHSMLFHSGMRKLFVFAGQRSKEYLNDFFSYNVDTDELELISDSQKKLRSPSPAAGFTQRATIDPDLNEIYIFSVSVKQMI